MDRHPARKAHRLQQLRHTAKPGLGALFQAPGFLGLEAGRRRQRRRGRSYDIRPGAVAGINQPARRRAGGAGQQRDAAVAPPAVVADLVPRAHPAFTAAHRLRAAFAGADITQRLVQAGELIHAHRQVHIINPAAAQPDAPGFRPRGQHRLQHPGISLQLQPILARHLAVILDIHRDIAMLTQRRGALNAPQQVGHAADIVTAQRSLVDPRRPGAHQRHRRAVAGFEVATVPVRPRYRFQRREHPLLVLAPRLQQQRHAGVHLDPEIGVPVSLEVPGMGAARGPRQQRRRQRMAGHGTGGSGISDAQQHQTDRSRILRFRPLQRWPVRIQAAQPPSSNGTGRPTP